MADHGEGEGAETLLSFKVKTSGDRTHSITMPDSATVLELKTKLAGEAYENVPVERQRLIYSGRVMKNDDPLSTYKIKAGNTIHMVKSAASNPTPPSASSSSAAPAPQAVPPNMAAGTAANNILAGLTGARFAGHANLPSRDLFGADGGMGAPPSEEEMADMLSNPAMAQTMNEVLNNPAFVDYMIQSNPMLANMPNAREMLQSPYFRSMLTDPNALRMAARMRRMMAGGAGGGFPAPGPTDTTPAGAPASDAAGGGAGGGGGGGGNAAAGTAQPPPNPFLFPGLFGAAGAPAAGGAGAGAGGAAVNPFAALLAPWAVPGAQPQGGHTTTGTANATNATNTPASPSAGATTPAAPPGGSGGPTTERGAGAAGSDPTPPTTGAIPPDFMPFFLPGTQAGGPAGQTPASNPFGLPPLTPEMLQQAMQMWGGAGAGLGGGFASPTVTAPTDNRPPEERYAEQLRQLNDMGFFDFDRNVAALRRSGGSVQGAVEYLLNGS